MVTDCPDEQDEILRAGRVLGVSIRSRAIREFCERAGIEASVEALNLPDDVKVFRMQASVEKKRHNREDQS